MQKYDFNTEATGTVWNVSIWSGTLHEQDSHDLWESCLVVVHNFEKSYSRFRDDSFISRLREQVGDVVVPREMVEMLRIYEDLFHISGGSITPLGGKVLSDMGYDQAYTFTTKDSNESVPAFSQAIQILSDTQIRIVEPVQFDLGALGKGYLIDMIMQQLQDSCKLERIIINAGGDIAHWSEGAQHEAKIGLENPEDASEAIGVLEIGNNALASSASNKRRWGKDAQYHHIYNAHSKKSVQRVVATWVVHPRAAIADALATSLFLVPPDALQERFEFDYAIVYADGTLTHSKFFNGAFFSA